MHHDIKQRLQKKAEQSACTFRVSAVAFDRSGNVIGYAQNMPSLTDRKGGHHAELRLIGQYGRNITTIVIMRIGRNGDMKPIHPCKMCAAAAMKFGIKIKTLMG